ncbi:MAG: UDP-N-acetylmuramoyl-tripeptide--D-alanyl-D-alanine ligase [Pseudomonadota bacterium]
MQKTTPNQFESRPGLWRWQDLCEASGHVSVTDTGQVNQIEVQRVSTDSRQTRPGDLFVALPGDPGDKFNPGYRSAVDGHDFVADALAAGAAGALVQNAFNAKGVNEAQLIRVADSYDGLWALGAAGRARLRGTAVAITGSSGKTTAKYFLSQALTAFTPPGSFNNHIGVPLALANTPRNQAMAVYEIGTNHPGEIEPLASMVSPHLAILLNVHSAHIENFSGRPALIKEKCSIFNGLRNKSLSISEDVLGLDHGYTFGESSQADARIIALHEEQSRARVDIDLFGQRVTALVPGGGLHRAKSVAATVLACQLLDQDLQPALALPDSLIPQGRGNRHVVNGILVIDESYNANPESMRATLAGFSREPVKGRRIVLLGEMLELGDASAQAHMDLSQQLASFDAIFCVGEATRALAISLKAPWFEEVNDALTAQVCASAAAEDALLIKGSNRVFWAHGYVQMLLSALQ